VLGVVGIRCPNANAVSVPCPIEPLANGAPTIARWTDSMRLLQPIEKPRWLIFGKQRDL
jgi:hypothetical protein